MCLVYMMDTCSLYFLAFSILLGVGSGQDTNLTLFKVSPCTTINPDQVTRFKSDIYAILPDLSNCSNISKAALQSGRLVSWSEYLAVNLWPLFGVGYVCSENLCFLLLSICLLFGN